MSESADQPALDDVGSPEGIAAIVEANRETIELVAAGDDGAAALAQNILDEADGEDSR